MIRAIFYKEWIKTRWYLLLTLITTLGFAGYSMLRIAKVIEIKGAAHVWEVMLSRDAIFVDLLQYIPMIVGILLAVVQFVPEMFRKCLKLTLHLPLNELKMVGMMLGSGFILLLGCFALNYLLMWGYLQQVLAPELWQHILVTTTPWYLAGLAGYLLVSWICLEPTWGRRLLHTVMTLLMLRIFFLSTKPGAYSDFIPLLTICTLLIGVLSWNSVLRFKAGKQD